MKKNLILLTLSFSFFIISCGETTEEASCIENSLRCSANKLQTEKCNADGEWVEETICATPTICTGSGIETKCEVLSNQCIKDSLRCNHDKSRIEKCDAIGLWKEETVCMKPQTCVTSNLETKCEAPSTDGPTVEEIQFISSRMNACGLYEEVSSLSEDIYMFINIANITKDSFLGKGLGIIALDDFQEILKKTTNCHKSTTTCTELATCLDIEITDELCDKETFTDDCESNKTVTCSWQGKVLKTTCETNTNCTIDEVDKDAECTKEEVASCDSNFVGSCNENTITTCEWGREKTYECAERGTCQVVDGRAKCIPSDTLPDCDSETFQSSCTQEFLFTCHEGKVIKSDCKLIAGPDFICKENPSFLEALFFGGCIHKKVATTCSNEPSCDGNILKYCVDGEEKTYNCTENDYNSCSTEIVKTDDQTKEIGLCIF